ncbi:MAG: hypothetical protein ACP5G0_14575 [Desulfomonilia bacterium]
MRKHTLVALGFCILLLPSILRAEAQSPVKKTLAQAISGEETAVHSQTRDSSLLETIQGDWVLMLHYPTQTRMVDITILPSGTVQSRNRDVCEDMSISCSAERSLVMTNARMNIQGILDQTGDHMKGMATIQGTRAPIPCSAFKILRDEDQE